jgi:heat shock protein HslJ
MGARTVYLATTLGLLALFGCAGEPAAMSGAAPSRPSTRPAATPSGGTGTMSIDALAGKTWGLTQLDEGSPAPAEPEVTLVFEKGKISGSGGCNQYFADVTSPSPGAIQVGPVGATKRFCVGPAGENEQRFFAALAKASRFTLEAGRLVLYYERGGEGPGKLIFTPRPAAR